MDPELVPHVPKATADSIFAALGIPERPVQVGTDQDYGGQRGHFDTRTREISLYEFPRNELPSNLVHELIHQASTADQFPSSAFGDLVRGFLTQFRAAPIAARERHLVDYFGPLEKRAHTPRLGPTSDASREAQVRNYIEGISERGYFAPEMMEVLARTGERGYELARRSNSPDIATLLAEAEEEFPGTQLAYDFFHTAFEGMGSAR